MQSIDIKPVINRISKQKYMLGDFFIWCAGSDKDLLSNCSKAERNKHIGYGSLVLIPALLAFISMSFALSTIQGMEEVMWLCYIGGIAWGLIIFSFDRFIVSTHRRKLTNKEEFQSPAFYLRFVFAFILGIVISHPLVMLYFDGSVQDKIEANVVLEKQNIQSFYDNRILKVENQISQLDSLTIAKTKQRDQQALIVSSEIDGEVVKSVKGQILTTGLSGKGPSAENKINQLALLQKELNEQTESSKNLKKKFYTEINQLKAEQDSSMSAFTVSADYLRRELALDQLKSENSIVGITQWFLICLFILVDILPVIFKTFAPFGMYDRILLDDEQLIKELDNSSRRVYNQKLYEGINQVSLPSES